MGEHEAVPDETLRFAETLGIGGGLVDDPEHLLLETAAVIERKDEQLSLVSQVHRSLRSTGWECTANQRIPRSRHATGLRRLVSSRLTPL